METWNGDPSLIRDTHIAKMVIDFRTRRLSVVVNADFDPSYMLIGGAPFTNVSPFSYIARGLRRMTSNEIARENL